jgi:SAM-dependent methyltransferase
MAAEHEQVAERARRAQSFGGAADIYDRARPDYPAEMFAHIAGHLPGPRVLEVGAGTGTATRGLTALGVEVTCVEPDPRMAAVLARRTAGGPPVHIEVETFESARLEGPYDGLVSAMAWHWTDPASRLDRAAGLLRPGGFLAICYHGGVVQPRQAFDAIEAVYDDFQLTGRDRPREPIGTASVLAEIQDPDTWPGDELAAHPFFDYNGTTLFPWQKSYTADEYAAYLESTSFYQVMNPEVCQRLLRTVTTTIREQFDNLISIEWSTQCYNAYRIGRLA